MLAPLEIDIEVARLGEDERRWLRAGDEAKGDATAEEVDDGVWFLALPQVGRLTSERPSIWMTGIWIAFGVAMATVMGFERAGHAVLGLAGGAVIVVGYVAFLARSMATHHVKERWTSEGRHGVLLTPNAIVLRRPAGVTRISRGAFMGVDDQSERITPEPEDEDRALSSTYLHRRVVSRLTNGRKMYRVVLAEAEGEPQVLGANDGLDALDRARLDEVKTRLDAWAS